MWTLRGELRFIHEAHQGAVFAVQWNTDGTLLATASTDARVRLWKAADGEQKNEYSMHSSSFLE